MRVAIVMVLLVCSVARADQLASDVQPGESEALYACHKGGGPVSVTFKPDTELKDVITWVMGFTCKDFVYDQRILATNKKVTIMAPQQMDPKAAYRVFLAALRSINLSVVPTGDALKIVDAGVAKHEALPFVKLPNGDNDELVRYVFHPSYAPVDQIVKAFGALKSDPGDIVQIGSVVMITDYQSHVREMMSFAALIDVPTGTDGIYTIHVDHADATKLADKITNVLATAAPAASKDAPAGATPPPVKIVVDERTNTLIVASNNASYERVHALVDRLDISLDIDGGQSIHVYNLRSTLSEELAQVLTSVVTMPTGQQAGAPTKGTTPTTTPPTTTSPTGGDLGAALEGKVRIIADKGSNKLVVISSGRDYLAIQDVIRQLDVPRREVYIEAMIMEVQMSNGSTFGMSLHGGKPSSSLDALLAGGIQMPDLKSTSLASSDPSQNGLATATGLVGALISNSSLNLFGLSIPSYGLLVNAVADSGNTDILSQPFIIALDNDEAKFKVGTNIPYLRGTIPAIAGSTTALAQNIDRKDLAIELDIKPHITTDNAVLLEIKHEANDAGDTTSLGPSWTTREMETKITVRDQQTVALGGMMQTREITSVTKVPILGDIPLLGYLFRYTQKTKRKSNLVILLTPYIINDQLDLERIRARKLQEHEEFVRAYNSLDGSRFQPHIDYAHKRGLLEDINRAVLMTEEDRATRDSFTKHPPVTTGPVQ